MRILTPLLALFVATTAVADVIPDRRVTLLTDTDLPGGDLASYLDVTLDSCQATCLADSACEAFTFNQRAGVCFIKDGSGTGETFIGAISGRIVETTAALRAQGETNAAELAFLDPFVIDRATNLARDIGGFHASDGFAAADLLKAADQAQQAGDLMGAFRFTGAALSLTDDPDTWVSYARLGATAASANSNEMSIARSRVLPAWINAYLRSGPAADRAGILTELARTFENNGEGRTAIPAMRLAMDLAPSPTTDAALTRLIGLYGFNVAETQVDNDAASPRICVNFNEPLVQAGVDYAPFVQIADMDFTVDVSDAQLCIDGAEHGQSYQITLRPGLPAASGEELIRPVQLTQYVRDRNAAVRFLDRAYILPRAGDIAIPVETVNLAEVDLTLRRMTDRNILRSMQDGLFGNPLYDWDQEWFDDRFGELVWQGTATVEQDLNRDVVTRLPLTRPLRDAEPGVYVVSAAIPGADPYETAAATQWFVLSDIGLATMLGNDGLTVSVRSLTDASALAGAEITLLSRANDLLGTAVTDDQGVARFDIGLTRGTGSSEPALVMAALGDDLSFLSLTDPAFDLSDRGVEGREPAGPIDIFLTTDRGAYRAGEVINLTALMRDGTATALPGVPLTAILTRPDGVEYSRIASTADNAGGHVFALPVAASAPRGTWTVAVQVDEDEGPLASVQVLVEDFLPERIDFDLAVPDVLRLNQGQVTVDLAANYLFGPPAADLPVEGEVTLSALAGLPDWPGYVFGLHDQPFEPRVNTIPVGTLTDAAGEATVLVDLPDSTGAVQPLQASFTLRLAEGSGRPVERRIGTVALPDTVMLGIRPLFDDVVPEGSDATFNIIALAPDLTPQAMDVQYTLNRIDTYYQWYQLYGSWNWEPTTRRERIAQGTLTLAGSAPGEVSVPTDWGQYELVIERVGGDYAAASVTFTTGWYAPASADPTPDVLEASLDAAAYALGDTATLRIVPAYAGTAIVSVLTDRVVSMQAVTVTAGENLITLPVTAEWGAGAYVTASVIRPMDTTQDMNPARSLGLAYAPVDPADRRLDVVLQAPLQAAPRETLTVGVDVQGVPGEPAFVTLAAVDIGILNLTGFDAPDPAGHYFGQRKLGVELRDVYGRLIDGMTGAMGSVRTGGDAMAQMNMQAPPPTEELVAFFSGPVEVDANGFAQVTFDLPSFNGTVRLMAVAWSPRGVGQAQMDVLVRDPVVVTASLPRFMAPGDTSRLLLEFVHAEGPDGQMGLTVTSDSLVFTGTAPETFNLRAGAKTTISLPFSAFDAGPHLIDVAVTTPDGRVLTKQLNLFVQRNDPAIARTLRLTLAPGETFTFDDAVMADFVSASASLTVGPLARLDAPGLLNILDRYPYGCTEQVTSQAMPLLYFDDVAAAMGLATRDEIALRIDQAITRVLANQTPSGSFGLWSPWSGDLWLDAYVTDFLSRARARGYAVPDVAWTTALDNLRNQVNYYPDFEAGGEDIGYALMVLARESAAAVGDLRYFADERSWAFTSPLASAQLGAALAYYGDQRRADVMFRQAMTQLGSLPPERANAVWRFDYGSNRRDTAAVLALAVEAGSDAVDAAELSSRLAGAGQDVSTQEAVWTLIAANAMIRDLRAADITVNGVQPQGPLVQRRTLDDGAIAQLVANTGTTVTDLTMTIVGVPTVPEPAGGNGYAITREYFTIEGNAVSPDKVPSGARLVTVLTVRPLGRQEGRLMVNDPLPAGFEIDNPNLIRAGDLGALDWLQTVETTHAEFRQERFMAAVDWYGDQPFRLAYIVRAVSPGTFHHPAASVEDMYRPQFRARTDTGVISVTE